MTLIGLCIGVAYIDLDVNITLENTAHKDEISPWIVHFCYYDCLSGCALGITTKHCKIAPGGHHLILISYLLTFG